MPLAFLTGGGSAIGEGIARALVARGWTVAVTDINLDLARQVAKKVLGEQLMKRRAGLRFPPPQAEEGDPPSALATDRVLQHPLDVRIDVADAVRKFVCVARRVAPHPGHISSLFSALSQRR